MGPRAIAAQVFASMALTAHPPHHQVVVKAGDRWFKVCACGRQRVWVSAAHDVQSAAELDPCEHQAADERTASRLKFSGAKVMAALEREEDHGREEESA